MLFFTDLSKTDSNIVRQMTYWDFKKQNKNCLNYNEYFNIGNSLWLKHMLPLIQVHDLEYY